MKERLIRLYEEARSFLIDKIKMDQAKLAYKRESIDEAEPEEIVRSIAWLEAFVTIRIGKYNEVRALVPEERWAYYEAICPDADTHEQQQLRAAEESLRDDWKHRPNLLRKIKNPKFDPMKKKGKKREKANTNRISKNSSGISNQSPSAGQDGRGA